MKRRKGFVSNSSTSSYCVYGLALEGMPIKASPEEVRALLERLGKSTDWLDALDSEEVEECYDSDFLYDLSGALGDFDYQYADGMCVFGRCLTGIGDDETGKQFKDSVDEVMRVLFGPSVKCEMLEGAHAS